MTKVFVQFAEADEAKIIAAFGCMQNPDDYPYQGEVDDSDPRYTAFITPSGTEAEMWLAYQADAQAVMDKTSITLERCFEAGIALPAAWVEYRKELRAILGAKTGDATAALPVRPAYPEGT